MTSSESALMKAAQLWCLPETEHCVMQPEICQAIAQAFDEYEQKLEIARDILDVYARHHHWLPGNMPNHAREALEKLK